MHHDTAASTHMKIGDPHVHFRETQTAEIAAPSGPVLATKVTLLDPHYERV